MPWVRSYVRSDGTPVRGHTRWAPGARREMTIFGTVAPAIVALSNGGFSGAADEEGPRPQSTVVRYPVRFDDAPPPRAQKPRPTVSYPIRWER